jgi:uncharacterized protein (TIGR03067 family)
MNKFAFSTAVACLALVSSAYAGDAKGPDAKCLDGAWTIACFEKNGEPQADHKGMVVKVTDGTITCSGKDGKPAMTMTAVLGSNGTIRITETDSSNPNNNKTKSGVYVLSKETLAICVHGDKTGGTVVTSGEEPKPHCVIILKREGSDNK